MSELEAKGPGGRPLDKTIGANFKRLRPEHEPGKGKSVRWYMECLHCGSEILHRDNRCLTHLANAGQCQKVSAEVRARALQSLSGKVYNDIVPGSSQQSLLGRDGESTGKKRRTADSSISTFIDRPLTAEQQGKYDRKLIRFVVHARLSFASMTNPFFLAFMKSIRPTYTVPSRKVLATTVLSSEAARVKIEQMDELQTMSGLTLLVDGWEDQAGRSLYGVMAAKTGHASIMLGVSELTGRRATADEVISVVEENMSKMGIDLKKFAAICTDNPSVMVAMRRKMEERDPVLLTYPCRLHLINTLIGKIVGLKIIKETTRKNARIVEFFHRSHYWGGQLQTEANAQNVRRGLVMHTESRWYALILMSESVLAHRKPIRELCERPEATKSKTGIASDVVKVATRDLRHWDLTDQLIRVCKPLVDMIGDLESKDVSLADAMFELLRCAFKMERLVALPQDDPTFFTHAQTTFYQHFQLLNTELSWFCLFLHPRYRRLAISQSESNRTYDDARMFALKLAKRWNWDKTKVVRLMDNICDYRWSEKEFKGSSEDAQEWWNHVRGPEENEHALKSMALILLGLVPHAAEVERLFSSLGAIQGDFRASLSTQTFEQLGMLRSYLTSVINLDAIEHGRVTRRTSAQVKGIDEQALSDGTLSGLSYSNSYDGHSREQNGRAMGAVGSDDDVGRDGDGDGDGDNSTSFPPTIISPTSTPSSELKKPSAYYNFKQLQNILEGRTQETSIETTIIPHRVVGQDNSWSVEELTGILGLTK